MIEMSVIQTCVEEIVAWPRAHTNPRLQTSMVRQELEAAGIEEPEERPDWQEILIDVAERVKRTLSR